MISPRLNVLLPQFNGDGYADLLDYENNKIFVNQKDDTFTRIQDNGADVDYFGAACTQCLADMGPISVADFDMDGDLDFAVGYNMANIGSSAPHRRVA